MSDFLYRFYYHKGASFCTIYNQGMSFFFTPLVYHKIKIQKIPTNGKFLLITILYRSRFSRAFVGIRQAVDQRIYSLFIAFIVTTPLIRQGFVFLLQIIYGLAIQVRYRTKAAENGHALHDFSTYDSSIATAGKENDASRTETAFSAAYPYIPPLAQTPDCRLILAHLQPGTQNLKHHEGKENSKEEFQFHGINRQGRGGPAGQSLPARDVSDWQSCGSHPYPCFLR